MIDEFDLADFGRAHTACGCEMGTSDGKLCKEGCHVTVENLVVALDCDKCQAFTEQDTRPDIISVRQCNGEYGWVIIETKSSMRPRAADQAIAALERLGRDPFFRISLADAQVVFIIRRRRRTDSTLMRAIGTLEAGPWQVIPRLLSSGSLVKCGSQQRLSAPPVPASHSTG